MAHITFTIAPGQSLAEATRTEHKRSPEYQFLRNAVGGLIETVPHLTSMEIEGRRVRCIVYVNEEGQIMRLPRNNTMSTIWKRELRRKAPHSEFRYEPELYGPAIIIVNANQLAAK